MSEIAGSHLILEGASASASGVCPIVGTEQKPLFFSSVQEIQAAFPCMCTERRLRSDLFIIELHILSSIVSM